MNKLTTIFVIAIAFVVMTSCGGRYDLQESYINKVGKWNEATEGAKGLEAYSSTFFEYEGQPFALWIKFHTDDIYGLVSGGVIYVGKDDNYTVPKFKKDQSIIVETSFTGSAENYWSIPVLSDNTYYGLNPFSLIDADFKASYTNFLKSLCNSHSFSIQVEFQNNEKFKFKFESSCLIDAL